MNNPGDVALFIVIVGMVVQVILGMRGIEYQVCQVEVQNKSDSDAKIEALKESDREERDKLEVEIRSLSAGRK